MSQSLKYAHFQIMLKVAGLAVYRDEIMQALDALWSGILMWMMGRLGVLPITAVCRSDGRPDRHVP